MPNVDWTEVEIAPDTSWKEVIEEFDNWEDAIQEYENVNFSWEDLG